MEEAAVDLVGDPTAQSPDGFGLGVATSPSVLDVVTGRTWSLQLGDGDAMESGVQLTVAASIQAEALTA